MVRIRAFEDQANQLYLSAKMPGLTHMYSGQEAVAVGICEALTVDDKITSTHRGHGHCVAKGRTSRQMFCELLGKEEGLLPRQGRSMHIADQSNGNLGANAIVGGSMGIATGARFRANAWARRRNGLLLWRRRDGAGADVRSDEHGRPVEAADHLCLRKQRYSEYTDRRNRRGLDHGACRSLRDRSSQVDGQDVLAVNKLAQKLVARCRKGEGPFFIELEPTAITATTSATSTASITVQRRRGRLEDNRDPITILASG